jgi:hypothetical protein
MPYDRVAEGDFSLPGDGGRGGGIHGAGNANMQLSLICGFMQFTRAVHHDCDVIAMGTSASRGMGSDELRDHLELHTPQLRTVREEIYVCTRS